VQTVKRGPTTQVSGFHGDPLSPGAMVGHGAVASMGRRLRSSATDESVDTGSSRFTARPDPAWRPRVGCDDLARSERARWVGPPGLKTRPGDRARVAAPTPARRRRRARVRCRRHRRSGGLVRDHGQLRSRPLGHRARPLRAPGRCLRRGPAPSRLETTRRAALSRPASASSLRRTRSQKSTHHRHRCGRHQHRGGSSPI